MAVRGSAHNNALNYRSLRSLDVQKLRFWTPVSLIVSHHHMHTDSSSDITERVLSAYDEFCSTQNIRRWSYQLILFEDEYRSFYGEELRLEKDQDIDACIAYLLVDPLSHRSGYAKEHIWYRLPKFIISEKQLNTLESIAISHTNKRIRREFWYMCRAMRKLGSVAFWDRVELESRAGDDTKKLRASWLLKYRTSLKDGERQRIKCRPKLTTSPTG